MWIKLFKLDQERFDHAYEAIRDHIHKFGLRTSSSAGITLFDELVLRMYTTNEYSTKGLTLHIRPQEDLLSEHNVDISKFKNKLDHERIPFRS